MAEIPSMATGEMYNCSVSPRSASPSSVSPYLGHHHLRSLYPSQYPQSSMFHQVVMLNNHPHHVVTPPHGVMAMGHHNYTHPNSMGGFYGPAYYSHPSSPLPPLTSEDHQRTPFSLNHVQQDVHAR